MTQPVRPHCSSPSPARKWVSASAGWLFAALCLAGTGCHPPGEETDREPVAARPKAAGSASKSTAAKSTITKAAPQESGAAERKSKKMSADSAPSPKGKAEAANAGSEASSAPKGPSDSAGSANWELSADEWRQRLSPLAYHVLREKGTERAFTGEFWNNKKDGTYTCAGCETPLFSSAHKFDSGTGWPSFWQPASAESVTTEEDRSFFSVRTEVLCKTCGGHLGHVFPDGPAPTGLRYCINSVSLKWQKAGENDSETSESP